MTWTKQNPASSPPALANAPMAYDAATGTAVLFGSDHQIPLGLGLADTWAWDGSTWTEQSPASSPARSAASLAYDAATGTAVLFGGTGGIPGHPTFLRGTWTWSAG